MRTSSISNKQMIYELISKPQYDFDTEAVKLSLTRLFAPDARIQLSFPFETLDGPLEFHAKALAPLAQSIPDLERRDTIIISGPTARGDNWVGCCGYFCGTFENDWLDIPATGHMVAMRFHEFYRFDGNRVVEMQSIWDIPEVMLQANAWPLVPSLGREWHVPAPASLDGIEFEHRDPALSEKSLQIVGDMCVSLGDFATDGVEAMRLNDYWHPRCSWYGPSGIGTARTIQGFRNYHQIPFLNGLPDRTSHPNDGHLFADNNYVGFTAWPGMYMTVSSSGWLGIAPGDQKIFMRSLDFWRTEGNLIRENWVLVDLLSVYAQIKVDVFARMKELSLSRH